MGSVEAGLGVAASSRGVETVKKARDVMANNDEHGQKL